MFNRAKAEVEKIDLDSIKKMANETGTAIADKAAELKDVAIDTKDDIMDKITKLDQMLAESITEYNNEYTLMNDKGLQLYTQRCRSTDSIEFVENLINSIANCPKSFEADFKEINLEKEQFIDTCAFADKELQAARTAAGGAGAGLAAGASVAFLAPSAAMWIATTFGTASTGTAISSLTGAAATKAALAWLGGGALASGGGGVAGGTAFLALAGPIGWSIAGATLLTSIVLFSAKKAKLNKEKNEEISTVKDNIVKIKKAHEEISALLEKSTKIREMVNKTYKGCTPLYNADYASLSDDQKNYLGKLVTVTKTMAKMLKETVVFDNSAPAEVIE